MTIRRPINIEGHDTEVELARKLGVQVSTLKRWRRETRKTGRQVGPEWTTADYTGRVIYPHEAEAAYLQSRKHRAPRQRASKSAA